MFSTPSWMMSPSAPSATVASSDVSRASVDSRSRSPMSSRRGGASDHNGAPATAFPITGLKLTEDWYHQNVSEPQIMEAFLEVPMWKRKQVILKCIEKTPENVHSWLFAVCRNQKNNDLEKRLLQQASVQCARSTPSPTTGLSPAALSPPDQRHQDAARQNPLHAAPVLPLLSHGMSGSPSHEAPRWSSELIALWPSQKSRLVAHFMALLSPTNQQGLAVLAPQTQACVALAVALLALENASADCLAAECVRRLQLPSPGSQSLTSVALPAAPAAAVVQLQLVFVSPENAVSLVFAKSFILAMDKMCPGAFNYLPLIVVSLQEGPSLTADADKLKLSLNGTVTCPESLETFVENSKTNFRAYHIKTLFVSMIHAVNGGSARMPVQRGIAALHADGCRFLWAVAKCSHLLRATTGDDAVCELTFAPSKLDEVVKMELAKVTGPHTSTANVSYNGVAPVPTVFATPSGCAIVQGFRAASYDTQVMDGWQVASDPTVSEDVSGGLISFIARTAEAAVFGDKTLSPLEQQTMDDFTMRHQETGERRLCSRDWWLRWYGYVKTPLQTMLSAQHPCHTMIFTVTGSPAPAGTTGVELCGKQRFCVACEKVFVFLDGTYCLPVMVDAAVALMVKARQLWASGQGDPAWARCAEVNRMHHCGPSCSLIV